jgi:hypothetical protein
MPPIGNSVMSRVRIPKWRAISACASSWTTTIANTVTISARPKAVARVLTPST